MSFPSSAIGHGGTGLRSGLLTFDELTELSCAERRAIADVRVGRLIGVSFVPIGPAYRASPITDTFDGVALDLCEVITSTGENLTRVESQPRCNALAGSFFWNQTTNALFVHLADGTSPNLVSVLAVFGRYFGCQGTVEPRLGRDVLIDGRMALWNAGGRSLVNWTSVNDAPGGGGVPGVRVSQDAVNTLEGDFSASIGPALGAGAGLSAGTNGGIEQAAVAATSGIMWYYGGRYRTSLDLPTTAEARILMGLGGGSYMDANGRDTTAATTGYTLAPTGGDWRRFLYVFLVPSGTTITPRNLLHNAGASTLTVGLVNFDSCWLMPAFRHEYVEPRLPLSGIPPYEIDTQSIAIGDESVGLGQMKLLNGDHPDSTNTNGYMEDFFGSRDVIGRQCQVWSLGARDNGEEITMDAAWPAYAGTVQDFDLSDATGDIQVQDSRSLLRDELPKRTVGDVYTVAGGASVNDLGRPMPIVIGGLFTGIKAPRVALGPTNRLPILLFNDPAYGLGTNICGQLNMYAYTDKDAADRQDTSRRVACEFTVDQLTGLVSLFSNPGPFEIFGDATSMDVVREVKPNDTLDFVDNVTTRAGALTPGLYTCTTLAAHAQTVMNAFGGGTFTVAYSNTSHCFTFTKTGGAGIFSMLLNTGVNKHRSAFPLFGFSGNADLTGAAGYTGNAVYDESRADEFHLRCDGTGYRDDTNGTFTGFTGGGDTALIYQPMDALRFLLVKVCRRPLWEVSDSSLTAYRSTGVSSQLLYLGGFGSRRRLTVQDIVTILANGARADISMDGAGNWTWTPRASSAAQLTTQAVNAPVLVDRDFISGTFRSGKNGDDIAAAVTVVYNENHSTGEPITRGTTNDLVALRHNRSGAATVHVALFEQNEAQARAWENQLDRVLPRRRLAFEVKGRLLRKKVGDLIRVQRTRMLRAEADGMLNSDVFRITAIGLDPQTHTTRVVCYTADLPRVADFQAPGQQLTWGSTAAMAAAQGPYPARREILVAARPGLR